MVNLFMITLTEDNFNKEVKQSSRPVLVSFCHSSDVSVPNFKCCRASKELANKWGIRSEPTILLFRRGKVTDTIVGSLRTEQLERILQ
jgi:thioredoxin-like negative regulator of GroEL